MSDQKKEEKIESLIKIKGIARKNAEYLLKIGINSPEELAQQKPSGLFAKFQELQKEGTISYETSERVCKQMIEEANAGNYEYAYAEEKYESLIDRSFENKLRLLLYMKCIKEENPDFIVDEEIFTKIDSNLEKEYKQIYRDMNKIREINKEIKDWKNNKQNDRKSIRLREIFEKSFKNSLPWGTFKKKYGKDSSKDRCCYYCEIKETEIEQMINDDKIYTKRLYCRGRKMEVERKEPFGEYNEENIELCCYWCNNAKSDEFTEKEFNKNIKEGIKNIWKERMKNAKE